MKLYFLIPTILLFIFGCKRERIPLTSDDTGSQHEIKYYFVDPCDLTFNHADSVESQFISVWWTDSLRPNPDTSNKFLHELGSIRFLFRDSSLNFDNLRFETWWDYSKINIKFDSLCTKMIADSKYGEWNVFEEDLRPFKIIEQQLLGSIYFTFEFKGVLNPSGLVSLYKDLPGVISCYRPTNGSIDTDLKSIYPFRNDSSHTYLILPSIELAGSIFYYFEVKDYRVSLIGYWDQQVTNEYPYWWEDATKNMEYFNNKE